MIPLENYSRRENLRFMNITERRDGTDCHVVYDVIKNELNIDPENIQFNAVHRIGKPREATDANPRPIIVRFLCREVRDNIYRVKNRLKKSRGFENDDITQDYAQAIQMERKVLIKAMVLAREKGANAKVVDRKLIIGIDSFHINNIPEEFRPPTTELTCDQAFFFSGERESVAARESPDRRLKKKKRTPDRRLRPNQPIDKCIS